MSETANKLQAKKALTLLTGINYLNYIDRLILSAVLVSIQQDLGLNDTQGGLLAIAFMLPYMFTSPLFGWLGDTRNRSKILAMGCALWSAATLATGFAWNFASLLVTRCFIGFGESAFTTVSMPYLSDYFPSHRRGKVFAIFSSALPVGAALGYVLGGQLSSLFGWRAAFMIVGIPGFILAFLLFSVKDPARTGEKIEIKMKEVLRTLRKSKRYVYTVLGYIAYTFVLGGVAHWIPTFMQRSFELTQAKANLLFGGIAVGSGLVGTLLGGMLGDWWTRRYGQGHLKISALSMVLALPIYYYCMKETDLSRFMVYLVATQFLFFLSTSPINVAILETVQERYRTSAMAFCIFLIHILGDAISPPLIGAISDATGSLQSGMLICTPMIALAAGFWLWGSRKHIESK